MNYEKLNEATELDEKIRRLECFLSYSRRLRTPEMRIAFVEYGTYNVPEEMQEDITKFLEKYLCDLKTKFANL